MYTISGRLRSVRLGNHLTERGRGILRLLPFQERMKFLRRMRRIIVGVF